MGKVARMNWEDQLDDIVRSKGSPSRTFEHWIDVNGYRPYLSRIACASSEMQARAFRSLYNSYLAETQGKP